VFHRELTLDEPQQVLLIETRGVVHVSVDLSNVVEVTASTRCKAVCVLETDSGYSPVGDSLERFTTVQGERFI
jgi:hypothetical protein